MPRTRRALNGLVLLFSGIALGQRPAAPTGMYCGGNELVHMGSLQASGISGVVMDPTGSNIPQARVQVQKQGSTEIFREIATNNKGRFHLTGLPPGRYWLGVSISRFNLQFLD